MSEKRIIILLPIMLSGCMMTGMPAMHGSSHARDTGTTLVKEVQTKGITAVLEVPPLTIKQEATLLLKIQDASTGEFMSNADVFASIQEERRLADIDTSSPVKKRFEENTSGQAYQLPYRFTEQGWHEIEVEIWHENSKKPSLVISTRKMVAVSNSPMSGTRAGYLFLAGGAAMLMMGLMMSGVLF